MEEPRTKNQKPKTKKVAGSKNSAGIGGGDVFEMMNLYASLNDELNRAKPY